MKENIKVSICCLTFNHEKFIQRTLDSFLMQETKFDFEILIHDDASTDRTVEIIKEYQEKYPNIIKPIFQSENQWSKGITALSATYNFPRAKGSYIAMCEGDDYWTDSSKLQEQVDFLDIHSEYSFVCSGYLEYNLFNNKRKEIVFKDPSSPDGFDITLSKMKHKWLTKTLTVMFRHNCIDYNEIIQYKYNRDIHIFYHLALISKGYYMSRVYGVYNVHSEGVHSGSIDFSRRELGYKIYEELYARNKSDFTRYMFLKSTLQVLEIKINNKNYKIPTNRLSLAYQAFRLLNNKSEFILLLKVMVPKRIKSLFSKN